MWTRVSNNSAVTLRSWFVEIFHEIYQKGVKIYEIYCLLVDFMMKFVWNGRGKSVECGLMKWMNVEKNLHCICMIDAILFNNIFNLYVVFWSCFFLFVWIFICFYRSIFEINGITKFPQFQRKKPTTRVFMSRTNNNIETEKKNIHLHESERKRL